MGLHSPIRVLLAEDDPSDGSFLREALLEAASAPEWPGSAGVDLLTLETLADVCDVAFDGGFDVILLNLSLPDSPVLRDTFSQVRSVVPGTAIVVLCDDDDPILAAHLLREGAQAVLVKAAIDARPLALAIRDAIERQRFVKTLLFAVSPEAAATAALPEPPSAADDADALLSLVSIAGVSGAELEAAMLAD